MCFLRHLRERRAHRFLGSMIGEIDLLQGSRATATIVARTAASALVIDYETLWKIHEGDRRTAVQFCRYLAKVSQPNDNKANLMSLLPSSSKASDVDVFICNNDDQVLQEAMRLRKAVHVLIFFSPKQRLHLIHRSDFGFLGIPPVEPNS